MNYQIKNDKIKIEVSDKGAELQSIKDDNLGYEYLWQGDAKFWTGRAPILFPIVGGLKEKTYLIESKKYSLPNHGLLRINTFELVKKDTQELEFTFRSNEETLKAYPFEFEFTVRYILQDKKLKIEHIIKNCSNREMPFGFGLHPAFNLDDKLQNTYIDLKGAKLVSTKDTDSGFIIDRIKDYGIGNLELKADSFDNDDTIIFEDLGVCEATLCFKNSERKVKMEWDKELNILAFWAKAGAPYICIEPWSSCADNINDDINELKDKVGVKILGLGESDKISYSIEVL